MRSDDLIGRDLIDIVCRLLKVFAFGFCAVMIFSLINTNSFESWSNVTAVIFTVVMVMSLIFLGHNLKKRWIDQLHISIRKSALALFFLSSNIYLSWIIKASAYRQTLQPAIEIKYFPCFYYFYILLLWQLNSYSGISS